MKIFLTGGTGLVGSNVLKVAREKYSAEIIASIYNRRPKVAWDCDTIQMDLEDVASIRAAVERCRPDVVIHCAAPRDEDRLEIDHDWGWLVMVAATRALAEVCREVGARLIFVSSDWVFGNGGQPPYAEDSPPCPVNYFGFLKVLGETLVSTLCPNYAIARTAGVYGLNWSDPDHEQKEEGIGFGWLPNYFVYRLSRGEPVAVWTDHVNILATPSLAGDVAEALLTLAYNDQGGIFHCCGREPVSRLELAQAVAEVFGFEPRLVRAALPHEMKVSGLVGKLTAPHDSRLKVTATETRLGRHHLGVREGLAEYRRQLEQ
ncbi:MAG: NAD(P)-dependent oxidoreductase [Chloroflexota bacterium]